MSRRQNKPIVLNENPDEVALKRKGLPFSWNSDTKTYNYSISWSEGITFSIFDSYFIFGKKGNRILHETIALKIKECETAIYAASKNEISMEELDDCITSKSLPTSLRKFESNGNISKKTLNMFYKILKTVDEKREAEKNSTVFVALRQLSLKYDPEILLGRIWNDSKEKVVSFWNDKKQILAQKNTITDFVSKFGNPSEYYYDIPGSKDLLKYEELFNNTSIEEPDKDQKTNFDVGMMHTLPPGEIKTQLQNMYGMRKSRPVDIRNKQLVQTSESKIIKSFSEWLSLKER